MVKSPANAGITKGASDGKEGHGKGKADSGAEGWIHQLCQWA